jgi:hypothetical protein
MGLTVEVKRAGGLGSKPTELANFPRGTGEVGAGMALRERTMAEVISLT